MLHRSFKANKCKTSLKLALSRTKLMKNKKVSQVSQLKKELANLLESGQNQTAGIRVEHVVREEKMVAAYDLLEIYCELIAARLHIIDSQKNCPIDLKEAISSVIFAAPRCMDVPELSEIRKHFVAKFGKEFATSALELRPECGVSRLLVEKLSISPLDGRTKLKLLSTVAEEHGVNWDPTTYGDSSLNHTDLILLQNPNTSPVPPSHPVIPRPSEMGQQNELPKPPAGPPPPPVSPQMTNPDHVGPLFRPEHFFGGVGSGETWAMGFKDVTSAARAAAESAERASFAARAAAELSTRGAHTGPPSPPGPAPAAREKPPAVVFDDSSSDDGIEKNPETSRIDISDLHGPCFDEPELEAGPATFDDSDSLCSEGDGVEFTGTSLNLGLLKGGLRNKPYTVRTNPVPRVERSDDDDVARDLSKLSFFETVDGSGTGYDRTEGEDGAGSGVSGGWTRVDQREGHVHPNLPDFDALSAHLYSLRVNRE